VHEAAAVADERVSSDNREATTSGLPFSMTTESFPSPPVDLPPMAEAERHSRIEELLLEGLDYYFAGQYERAITVWTRVAFLERGHGRARAYIERARSAQAEQQRQSEELLHAGVAAYHAGELQAARDLLTRSVEEGGPHETALVYLERLGRAESVPMPIGDTPPIPRRVRGHDPTPMPRIASGWTPTLLASAAVVAAVALLSLPVRSFLVRLPVSAVPATVPQQSRLPIAHDAGRQVARARAIYRDGRPYDALRLLEQVASTDEVAAEANALRAEIQRVLLARVVALPARGEP